MRGDDIPVLRMADAAAWAAWLEDHHADSPGVWLVIARKGSAGVTVSYDEALQAALCYGWIDGQKAKLDEEYWLQRFTPRKPGSRWSKINTERAAELIAAARMRPAGLREVDAAKADGRWDAAYRGQRSIEVPGDLARALAENDAARAFFETLSSVNRYAILYRIGTVKRPKTRARKIAQYVAMLAEHKTIHPQPGQ
jgi:uncharacterized protein YdeI (YjbR/CyaY-like superfamily)